MKKQTASVIFFCLFAFVYLGQIGCANIIPPGGGPRDSLPPILITALPKDSTLNFNSNKIVLTFNEFVEVRELTENLVVSPLPKNNPIVDFKLRTVTIKLKDSLVPNTTYTIDFGNSIKDVNEGNAAKNFMYVFSTGNVIDNNSFSGKVIVAETGLIDSTIIAALYKNTNDTAIITQRPNYIAKLQGDGSFKFVNLPIGNFKLYVINNSYSKKYDDSTQLFAFYDSLINIGSTTSQPTLYAFQEAKKNTLPTAVATSTKAPTTEKEKQLKYATSLEQGKQDILDTTLTLSFNRKIKNLDVDKIALYDTNYKKISNYNIELDSTKQSLFIHKKWVEKFFFYLVLQKDCVVDTTNTSLTKTDTLKFSTKNENEYGSVKIRFNNIDTAKHHVLLIYKEGKLFETVKITQPEWIRKLYYTGEFDLKILTDTNNNGIWDTGNYKQKKQPEVIKPLSKKLSVRANWENETEITL